MPLEPVSALELLCHVFVPQNIKNTMSPLLEARVLDIFSEAAWDVPVCSRSGAKKVMSLWKTLEDTVEDVDSARIFGWKTQIQLFKLKKILYSFIEFASSKEMCGRCPRLPRCLPASSYETWPFSLYRYTSRYIFLVGARGCILSEPGTQCISEVMCFIGDYLRACAGER